MIELFVYNIYYVDCVANKNYNNSERIQILYFFENQPENIDLLLSHLKITFPHITSLQYVINQKGNDTLQDLEIIQPK